MDSTCLQHWQELCNCCLQGQQLVQLRTFVATAQDPRFSALANAASEATSFSESAHQLIYDLLMLKASCKSVCTGIPWRDVTVQALISCHACS